MIAILRALVLFIFSVGAALGVVMASVQGSNPLEAILITGALPAGLFAIFFDSLCTGVIPHRETEEERKKRENKE